MTDPTVDVKVAFGPVRDEDGAVRLSVDGQRPISLASRMHRPALVRDALLALGDVLGSDLRHRGRDRADYLAYLLSKGKGVSKQVWEAQKEFLRLKYSEAARDQQPLDPVITAGDGLRIELLSRDESAYAQLAIGAAALVSPPTVAGTSYLDLTPAALRALARVRSYRPASLELVAGDEIRERRVPLRWLRAFGQMQAAALLPADTFELAPIDLYNVLLSLRLRKARKAPRALRYELVPGQTPRLVLEPWDLVLSGHGAPYAGNRPKVIRTWGRNRLLGLARVLPHATRLRVHLLGAGLPSFYVAELPDLTLTLALSGWTDGSWAGISTFDQLAGRVAADGDPTGHRTQSAADAAGGEPDAAVAAALAEGPATVADLVARTGRPASAVRAALATELTSLRAGADVAAGRFFARPLLATSLPAGALRYRDAREEHAHRLLAEPGAVTLTKLHDLGADGQTVEGTVDDSRAHRRFHPQFTLDSEGRTSAAQCTCATFRRGGLREGPCEHMMALRVLHAREQAHLEAARGTAEGRQLIRSETRTLFRRSGSGSETFRLSLDDRAVVARWGQAEPLRFLRQLFATTDEARTAYFARLDDLEQKGYVDAGA